MKIVICSTIAVLLGMGLDFVIGDPGGKYHPICLIGNLISFMEKRLRREGLSKRQLLLRGGFLVLVVTLISFSITLFLSMLCYRIHIVMGMLFEMVLSSFLLSTKTLKKESLGVKHALEKEGLAAGRKQVSRIVGRDTQNLSEEGVIKACVETVAENTSDGSVAPLFYMLLGGASLGVLYKAVNTMDSMIGYKNDNYLYFGRIAAKTDDVMNYIPARIAALVMLVAGIVTKLDWKNGYRIFKRDRYNHASPNSAQTESCIAGLLGVQLAGDAWYFGSLYEKPTIGDSKRKILIQDIVISCKLMYCTVLITAILLVFVKGAFIVCMNMVGM